MNPTDNFAHLPQNSAVLERAVLGVMMTSPAALSEALGLLKEDPEIFYHLPHQPIYRVILDLRAESRTADFLTVTVQLAKQKKLDDAGGAAYVKDLMKDAPHGLGIRDYCLLMRELYTKRRVSQLARRLVANSNDPATEVDELLAEAFTELHNIQHGLQVKTVATVADMLDDVVDGIVQAAQTPGGLTGVPSGLESIDAVTGGWQPSDLIIIAARPGVGKTSFALAQAVPAALRGYPGVIFNLEMNNAQMVRKMIATEVGEYSTSRLQRGDFSGGVAEAETLRERAARLRDPEIYLLDTAGMTLGEFRSHAARLKAQHDIRWIVVDYLQLMTAPGKGSREQEVSAISRGLKLTAKELNVPVLALSQLSRAVEGRGGEKKPQLSDLRESGSIEQDADVVVFLYRPDYYGIQQDEMGDSVKDTTAVIFAKHRNGPLEEVVLGSTMKNGRYYDLSPDDFRIPCKPEPVAEPARYQPEAEHFGPRIIGQAAPFRTAGPSEFSDDGEPVS